MKILNYTKNEKYKKQFMKGTQYKRKIYMEHKNKINKKCRDNNEKS